MNPDKLRAEPAVQPNPWKQAIDDELANQMTTADSFSTPQAALAALLDWHAQVALDPAVSTAALALIDQGKASKPEADIYDAIAEFRAVQPEAPAVPSDAGIDLDALPVVAYGWENSMIGKSGLMMVRLDPGFYPDLPSKLVRLEDVRAALAAPRPAVPVLCVSSKGFARMRAGDDHIKAWLPPATESEDMLLYAAPRAEASHLASSDPEGHRQAIADHEAEQQQEEMAQVAVDVDGRLANIRVRLDALSQPTQAKGAPSDSCIVQNMSSRICQRGTKSCVVDHPLQPTQAGGEPLSSMPELRKAVAQGLADGSLAVTGAEPTPSAAVSEYPPHRKAFTEWFDKRDGIKNAWTAWQAAIAFLGTEEHQIIARFLERTGQWVINEATRDAAIQAALDTDRAARGSEAAIWRDLYYRMQSCAENYSTYCDEDRYHRQFDIVDSEAAAIDAARKAQGGHNQ